MVEHYKRVLNVPEIMEWVKKRPLNSKLVVAIVATVKLEKGPKQRF